jgi:hypothetical protein
VGRKHLFNKDKKLKCQSPPEKLLSFSSVGILSHRESRK